MPFEVRTEVVSARAHGDDRVGVFEHPAGTIIIIADGVGGIAGGSAAADAAVRLAGEAVAGIQDLGDPAVWSELLRQLDRQLAASPDAGETTCVIVGLSSSRIAGASVGDSGAWLVTPADFDDLTRAQHRKPVIGSGAAVPISFELPRSLAVGEALLVATDGLLKYSAPRRICDVVRREELASVSSLLIELVRLRSGQLQDDIAIAVCRTA